MRLGRRDEAGQSIEAALRHNPEDPFTHANQGWTLLHEGQSLKAMEHFKEALRLEPNFEWARAGIVEAMKARNPIYRWLLKYFLWMQRFPPKVQVALLLGAMFGNQLVISRMDAVPTLAPFSGYVAFCYILFVWMSWTAPTLFNLVLRLNRFGRLVLNDREKLESTLAAACIGCVLLSCLISLIVAVDSMLRQTGVLFLGLMLPVTYIFRAKASNRKLMVAYTIGLTAVILFTLLKLGFVELAIRSFPNVNALEEKDWDLLKRLIAEWERWFGYSLNGIVWSTWLARGLSLAALKR